MRTTETVQSAHQVPDQNASSDWGQVGLGVLPFLLLGSALSLLEVPVPDESFYNAHMAGGILLLALYPTTAGGLLWGWLHGFPRWVFPYLGFHLIFALFLSNASTPGLNLFGIYLWGGDLWGWRAFILLGVVAVIAQVLSRPFWGNLQRLISRIGQDWTLVSFGLYAGMNFLSFLSMDEIENSWRIWPTLVCGLVITLGAIVYMRLSNPWLRMTGLLTCAAAAALIMTGSSDYYWQTHIVNFATGESRLLDNPVNWSRLVSKAFGEAGFLVLVLIAPGLVRLVRWVGAGLSKGKLSANNTN